jgi:hypothetical protein
VGTPIGVGGSGSTCQLCDNLYVTKLADSVSCFKKVSADNTYNTFVDNCQYMIAGTNECFYCEDKYTFAWNAGGTSWPGKQKFIRIFFLLGN